MPRVEVLADHDAGVLDHVVRKEQLATDHRCVGMTLGVAHECVQPSSVRDRIVVQKHQVLARGRRPPVVAGSGEAGIRCVCHNTNPLAVVGEELLRRVGRCIIDYDNLEIDALRMALQQSVQALAGE
jgi:hypothetical protein